MKKKITKCVEKKLSAKELREKVVELEKKIQGLIFDYKSASEWKGKYYAEKCQLEKQAIKDNEEISRLSNVVCQLKFNEPDIIELKKQAIIDRKFISEHSKTIKMLEVKIARDYDSKIDELTVESKKYKKQAETRLDDIDSLSEEMSIMESGVLNLIKQLGKQ